jgi:hypothetical protein
MMALRFYIFLVWVLSFASAQLIEVERKKEYLARNYTWPLPFESYVPRTKGWKDLMEHRFRQVAEIDDNDMRYEGYIQTLNAAVVAPNFTQYGWGLARAPDDLMEALRKGIHDGVAAGPKLEEPVEVIEGDQPWFIDRPDLTQRVLKQLQHYPGMFVCKNLMLESIVDTDHPLFYRDLGGLGATTLPSLWIPTLSKQFAASHAC